MHRPIANKQVVVPTPHPAPPSNRRYTNGARDQYAKISPNGDAGSVIAKRVQPGQGADTPIKGTARWQRVQKLLRSEFGEDVYTSWFAACELEQFQDSGVHLSVPTRFLKSWIKSHYEEKFLSIWQQVCPDIVRIDISVRSARRVNRVFADDCNEGHGKRNTVGAGLTADMANGLGDSTLKGSPLDPKYTFSNFVIGRSNTLAHAATKQMAACIGSQQTDFSPLYIHGSVGLGKTHLLHAAALDVLPSPQKRRVLYLTAEHFMHRFVHALSTKSALSFKEALRGIDLLLIDDLQFLQGKTIQQEFCHTLNSLIDSAKHVIIAADRPPVDLQTLDERVRSRLSGGLVAEIHPMDMDVRWGIVQARAAAARARFPGIEFPEPVLEYIARSIVSNGRDLDGAINRLVASNQLTGEAITISIADQALRDLVRARDPKVVRIEDIQRIVASHFNVSRSDLISSRRARAIVRPRQIAMYLAKKLTPRSLPEIGRRFGNRDHTTVLHAIRKIEQLMDADAAMHEDVELLRRMLLD